MISLSKVSLDCHIAKVRYNSSYVYMMVFTKTLAAIDTSDCIGIEVLYNLRVMSNNEELI